ncbi:hypothetical protein BH09GEM1_BH09GEM1_26500 [soil metagenome]
MLNRRAASLIELLVALTLGSIVLAAATSSVLRQQRTHERIASVAASDVQLRTATTLLASQLSFIDAAAGDPAAGEARDTALQLRATIAVALACDRGTSAVTLLPDTPGAVALSGFAAQPRAGDSLWYLTDSTWRGTRVEGAGVVTATCPAPFLATGPTVRLTLAALSDTIPAGAPLRVTRPTRYAFYRSGDGTWQLGFREWSDATGAFSAPQPVAGPLLRQSDSRRSRFRFFDAFGEELTGSDFEARIARVRIVTHALSAARERGQDSVRSDSVDVALQRAPAR